MFTIDARQSELRLQDLNAQLARMGAERTKAEAERRLIDRETQGRLASEEAKRAAAAVAVSTLDPEVKLAEREHARAKSLFEKGVTSRRQLDEAETSLTRMNRELSIAIADLRAAEAQVTEAAAERERLSVLDSELQVIRHREAEVSAKLEEQMLDISDRIIRAPVAGVVSKTFVEQGEYVTPGQRLALVHDPNDIWVTANIKETSVRKLQVGDRVAVNVDAYPDQPFDGRVAVIGGATTASFALLPSPNPSGNFTKITQRIPVRISVPQDGDKLKPGMLVEIKIDVDQPRP